MKNTILIRKSVQIALLTLFLVTVLQADYPFRPWVPPELFLWLDPLAGITTTIAARTWIPWFLLALIVLLSPLIVGRGFCGWVCPLGTTIDMTDRLVAPRKNPKKAMVKRRFSHWKTFMLVFFLIAAVAGLQYAWLMDPIPLLWRTFGAVIFPGVTFLLNGLLDLILKLGIRADFIFAIYDYLSLHVLPLETSYIQGAWLVALMFVAIIGLSRISRRFWCRNLCPLGGLLGLLSKFSLLQRVVADTKCSDCMICARGCKMEAINDDYITTEKAECIFCLNCSAACLQHGTNYAFRQPSYMASAVDLKRRGFVLASASGIAYAGAVNLLTDPERRDEFLLRPPGAHPEDEFLDRCIRCNECVRICSTTGKCLQPVIFEGSLAAFWTPLADFGAGYCEYGCNLCGEICPTSAIKPLPLAEKQQFKMGLAIINEDLCLPFCKQEECLVCEEHCPIPDKAIEMWDREFTTGSGEKIILKAPHVCIVRCTGCGICELKCPVEGVKAIRIVRPGSYRFEKAQGSGRYDRGGRRRRAV